MAFYDPSKPTIIVLDPASVVTESEVMYHIVPESAYEKKYPGDLTMTLTFRRINTPDDMSPYEERSIVWRNSNGDERKFEYYAEKPPL
jgi:hypothetical protein